MMVSKLTRVICQGFTGKQVAIFGITYNLHLDTVYHIRVHSTVNRLLLTALTWLGVCPQEREERLTWGYLYLIQLQR